MRKDAVVAMELVCCSSFEHVELLKENALKSSRKLLLKTKKIIVFSAERLNGTKQENISEGKDIKAEAAVQV